MQVKNVNKVFQDQIKSLKEDKFNEVTQVFENAEQIINDKIKNAEDIQEVLNSQKSDTSQFENLVAFVKKFKDIAIQPYHKDDCYIDISVEENFDIIQVYLKDLINVEIQQFGI